MSLEGGVELPLEKAEAIFGINIMAVIMLDDANLRCVRPPALSCVQSSIHCMCKVVSWPIFLFLSVSGNEGWIYV
jgi:hypothetical protein